jgi:ligand-binding sensor domain-containing protein
LNKKTTIALLITFSNLIGADSNSQERADAIKPAHYRAVQWTMKDGLSAAGIHTMIKDANGFLWVGSHLEGFCRFDGAKFKKYPPDQNNRNTINSDKIISFTEDSVNNIWIVTEKGLSRYDIKADTFTNFSPLNNSAVAFAVNNSATAIVPIGSTKDTIYCMEPGSLITAFDVHTLKRGELLKLSPEIDTKIVWNTNKSFFDARSKSIWKLKIGHTTVLEQIFLDGKTKFHPWSCSRNNVNHRHDAEDMKYDPKRNSIWVNSGDGLLEFSLNDQKFHIPGALNSYIKSEKYDRDVGIDIDIDGRVWFATKSHGILIYDPKIGTVQPLFSSQDPQKKAGDANLHIYCDRDGIVWTTNYQSFGIYELLPFNHSVKRYPAKPGMQDSLSNGYVITIIPAAQNKMWIGTYDG